MLQMRFVATPKDSKRRGRKESPRKGAFFFASLRREEEKDFFNSGLNDLGDPARAQNNRAFLLLKLYLL